jgi:hypothetical protein
MELNTFNLVYVRRPHTAVPVSERPACCAISIELLAQQQIKNGGSSE